MKIQGFRESTWRSHPAELDLDTGKIGPVGGPHVEDVGDLFEVMGQKIDYGDRFADLPIPERAKLDDLKTAIRMMADDPAQGDAFPYYTLEIVPLANRNLRFALTSFTNPEPLI